MLLWRRCGQRLRTYVQNPALAKPMYKSIVKAGGDTSKETNANITIENWSKPTGKNAETKANPLTTAMSK